MTDTTKFQYCQKLVIFSEDRTKVLLAKRKGEADFDGVYSFIGGKMETTDSSIIEGMRREKNEEIGTKNEITIYPTYVHQELFTKSNGDKMILPHYFCIFNSGVINLNEEYSGYDWFEVDKIAEYDNIIPTVPIIISKMKGLESLILQLESKRL